MSEEFGRLAGRAARRLLRRILDQENLVAAVQGLSAQALGKLINHVGLEDAGEIVALATTEQLRSIFDEDVWRSPAPGKDESFDADRFALWLEVMLEAGEEFAAKKLAELPEDLVTLAFHEQVLVVNIEDLAITMSSRAAEHPADEDVRLEKALESCLAEELGEYRIISRRHDTFDTFFGLLVTLDQNHHDFVQRLLDRLCAMDTEIIEDSGGLYDVLSAAESLASDAAAEREDRRAELGYIAPSSAAAFLALARSAKLEELVESEDRDPITRAYFRQLASPTAHSEAPEATGKAAPAGTGVAASGLLRLLQEAEILPPARITNLLEASRDGDAAKDSTARQAEPEITRALRTLADEAPERHNARMRELAYLGNVLAAGCSLTRRAMRPVEAARAAVTTSNLGLTRVLAAKPGSSPVRILAGTPADRLFRIGWNVLFRDLVCPAIGSADALLSRLAGTRGRADLQRAHAALNSAIASGRPWIALHSLQVLAEGLSPGTLAALLGLLDECPCLAGDLATGEDGAIRFVATEKDLERARGFLEKISHPAFRLQTG